MAGEKLQISFAKTLYLIGILSPTLYAVYEILMTGYVGFIVDLGVPILNPAFSDVQTIISGQESMKLGFDPMVNNPSDPWLRPLNYPRVWQLLYIFDLNPTHAVYFGCIFASLYFITALSFQHFVKTPTSALILLSVFLSPAAWLALERANNDLLILFLMAVLVLLPINSQKLKLSFRISVGFLAVILKLYPVFCFLYLLRYPREQMYKAIAIVLFLTLAYFFFSYADLILIRDATPQQTILSFGRNVIWMRMQEIGSPATETVRHITNSVALACILIMFSCMLAGLIKPIQAQKNAPNAQQIDAFLVGSGIFLGTYILGNNFDYRLLFVAFTLPLLLQKARYGNALTCCIATITITAILLSSWSTKLFGVKPGIAWFFLEEIFNWLIFLGLSYFLSLLLLNSNRQNGANFSTEQLIPESATTQ